MVEGKTNCTARAGRRGVKSVTVVCPGLFIMSIVFQPSVAEVTVARVFQSEALEAALGESSVLCHTPPLNAPADLKALYQRSLVM